MRFRVRKEVLAEGGGRQQRSSRGRSFPLGEYCPEEIAG